MILNCSNSVSPRVSGFPLKGDKSINQCNALGVVAIAFQAVASQKVYGTTLLFYSAGRCKYLTPTAQILPSKCLDFTPQTVVRKTKPIVVKIISNLKKIISKII